MAVSRSPFSQSNNNDWSTPWGSVTGTSSLSSVGRGLTNVIKSSVSTANYKSSGGKTSAAQEAADLETSVNSAKARIGAGTSSNKANMMNAVDNISQGKGHSSSGGGLWGALKKIGSVAVAGPLKVMEVSAAVGQGVQSAFKETTDAIVFGGVKLVGKETIGKLGFDPNSQVSWKEFTQQATDKDWKLINTGVKWLDGTLDFGVDVLTDPITYAGIGAVKYAGKAGRIALATKFGTSAMRAKYPMVVLDDVLRYGEHAIPKFVRQAEGIKVGVRYAGKVVPHTEKLAAAVTGKYGLITGVKNVVGDSIYKLPYGPEVLTSLSFKSKRAIVASGAGRSGANLHKIANENLVPLLAENTARRMARGATAVALQQHIGSVKNLLDEMDGAGIDTSRIVRMIDSHTADPAAQALRASATQEEKAFLARFLEWQNGLRDEVNKVYSQFGIDFGVDAKGIGFVDDYIHHTMTDEAKKVMFNKSNPLNKLFNFADLSADDITGFVGGASHRKYIKGEKFMGEELKYGSIDEINQIFAKKVNDPTAKFFETDLRSISDSYAYSLAKARGRESYIRRLMDFDNNAVMRLGKKMAIDDDLVAELSKSHKVLVESRDRIARAVDKRFATAKLKAEDAIKLAESILSGKRDDAARNTAEIAVVRKKLEETKAQLVDSLLAARGREANVRAAFYEQHRVLMNEIATLRSAIDDGAEQSYIAVKQLQEHYMAMFPEARTIPTDPNVLAERILTRRGVATSKELKILGKREREILQKMEATPRGDKEMIDALNQELKGVRSNIDGHTLLADVRVRGDYTMDGLLYGDASMLRPIVPDPNGGFEQPPFRWLDSEIIDPAAGNFDNPAWRDEWKRNPNSVAVHAIDPDELVDMRDPEGFAWFFSPENDAHAALGEALTRSGLPDGQVFMDEYTHMIQSNGQMDPMFEEMFPEMADLMVFVWNADQIEFPTGVASEDVVASVFGQIQEYLTGVVAREGYGNADVTAKRVYDEFLGIMANRGAADRAGFVMPSRVIHGIDNTDAVGRYSVILNDSYDYTHGLRPEDVAGKPTSTVHFVADENNAFIKEIVDGDYETASLTASQKSAEITGQLADAELNQIVREELANEAKGIKRQVGAVQRKVTAQRKKIEKSLQLFADSGELKFSMDGGKTSVQMGRDKAMKLLTRKERQLSSKREALEKTVEGIWDDATRALYRQQTSYEERLVMGLRKAQVLENWNDTVGNQLERDIEIMRTVFREKPAKGATHDMNMAWLNKVQGAIDSTAAIQDKSVAKAYRRVVTQLHADEAQLALFDSQVSTALEKLNLAQKGWIGDKWIDDVNDGWMAIHNMGVQIPDELTELWKPQLDKLYARYDKTVKAGFLRAVDAYNQFFKTYAVMTPGFHVRNALSSTFMNFVAGVDTKEMMNGIKVLNAVRKYGPDWIDNMGLDAAERKVYEQAYRVLKATTGMDVEMLSPMVSDSRWSKIINNRFSRWSKSAGGVIEDSARLPMALDSIRKGYSFDEAVERISRYHFDYADLSKLDEVARRFVPFWIWTTRNIPLQLVEQWARPSTYATYNKIVERNPVNADLVLPKYIREVRPLGFGAGGVLMPDLPHLRLDQQIAQLSDPTRLVGMMTPLLKVPIEVGMLNKQAALDIPFTNNWEEAKGVDKAVAALGSILGVDAFGKRDPETGKLLVNPRMQYAIGNMAPPIAQLERLTGGAAGGKATYDERQLGSLLNWLGIPYRNVGPQQQRSELIRRQFEIAKYLKNNAGKLGPKD